MNFLYVFIGAGIGGTARYWLSGLVQKYTGIIFPLGTLAVNFAGSLILGLLIFGLDEKDLISKNYLLLLGTGFCGGFTTFSTFSVETFSLMRNSEFFLAGGNILLNVLTTLIGVYLAYTITR